MLLALTVVVGVLTVVPGRATRLQGGVHLVLLAAFVVLAAEPVAHRWCPALEVGPPADDSLIPPDSLITGT